VAKVLCVLCDDPVDGYPRSYARDAIPRIERYHDGQTTPTPERIDFEPGELLGSVSGELGLRRFLDERGHAFVVTSDDQHVPSPRGCRSTGREGGRADARRATILEACCFVGAAGGVAGAVRMSAGARQRAAIDDQVFVADRTGDSWLSMTHAPIAVARLRPATSTARRSPAHVMAASST
jgi:hypothetical protein